MYYSKLCHISIDSLLNAGIPELIPADDLQDFTAINGISEGARYHHERYDGKGYNEGLKGEEIPLFERTEHNADKHTHHSRKQPHINTILHHRFLSITMSSIPLVRIALSSQYGRGADRSVVPPQMGRSCPAESGRHPVARLRALFSPSTASADGCRANRTQCRQAHTPFPQAATHKWRG